ncbi:hypothetical protein G4B88_015368, partial [Cannabis sativa]
NHVSNSEGNHIENVFNKLLKDIGSPVDFRLPDYLYKTRLFPTYTFIKRSILLLVKVLVIGRKERKGQLVLGDPSCCRFLFSAFAVSFIACEKFKIYISPRKRRLKDDQKMMAYSVHAVRHQSLQCAVEIATVGKDSESFLCFDCCLCRMLLSSCSSGCKCDNSCINKPFQNRPVKRMKLVQTKKCGFGIVALEDISQGEFVIEYVGEVIDDKTCETRLWQMKHRGETNFYLCEINRDMVIDATYKGNKIIDGETRIGIFATRDIKKGEHLTYDYQFVQFGADQDCHCGAVECRRKLGVKPTKPKMSSDAALKLVCQVAVSSPKLKAILSANDVCQNGEPHIGSSRSDLKQGTCSYNCIGQVVMISHPMETNRSFGIIERFDAYSKKHLIMYEDGDSEFLDMTKVENEYHPKFVKLCLGNVGLENL